MMLSFYGYNYNKANSKTRTTNKYNSNFKKKWVVFRSNSVKNVYVFQVFEHLVNTMAASGKYICNVRW